MNGRLIFRLLGMLGGVLSFSMTLPLFWAWYDGSSDFLPLFEAMLAGMALSAVLFYVGGGLTPDSELSNRDAFAVVTFGWLYTALIGGLPYWFSGALGFVDSWFESMSGFTTTGATVLANVEALGRGMLFWRSLTHWLGGMGILVLCVAILPLVGVGGMELYKAETPTPLPEKLTPKVQDTAVVLWLVYLGLTLAETVALKIAGLGWFDSLTHSFSTLATGGFSNYNASVAALANPAAEWIIIAFMLLAGVNFTLHYLAIRGKAGAYLGDDECRFYLQAFAVGTLICTFAVLGRGTMSQSLRQAAFTVASTMTTTGFVVTDYSLWPPVCHSLLLALMFLGGCAGSTAGGVKHLRFLVAWRRIVQEMRRLLQPRRVSVMRLGDVPLAEQVISSMVAFLLAFIILLVVSTFLLTACGYDLVTSFTASLTCLANTGPGLGLVGPVNTFAPLSAAAKLVLSIDMLLGRLEVMTVLMLFYAPTWRGSRFARRRGAVLR